MRMKMRARLEGADKNIIINKIYNTLDTPRSSWYMICRFDMNLEVLHTIAPFMSEYIITSISTKIITQKELLETPRGYIDNTVYTK